MKNIIFIITVLALLTLSGAGQNVAYAADLPGDAQLASQNIATAGPGLRAQKLSRYLQSQNSPLTPYASWFVSEADKNGLDWRLVAAISGVESTFGQAIPAYSYNAWGWGVFTGQNYGIDFKNWKDGITQVSEGLKQNYVNRGAATIDEIGQIYAASPAWSGKVRFLVNQINNYIASRPELIEITL